MMTIFNSSYDDDDHDADADTDDDIEGKAHPPMHKNTRIRLECH
jgi:hypothetical protein